MLSGSEAARAREVDAGVEGWLGGRCAAGWVAVWAVWAVWAAAWCMNVAGVGGWVGSSRTGVRVGDTLGDSEKLTSMLPLALMRVSGSGTTSSPR